MDDESRGTEDRLLGGYSGRVFVILTVGLFAMKLSKRFLPPLLPVIVENLGITSFAAGIAISVFKVTRAGSQYPGGRLADQLSRKTVVVGSLLLVTVGFLLLSVTSTFGVLLVGVAVTGSATGLFAPASRALLSDHFVSKRGRAFGFNMSASEISGIVAVGVSVTVVAVWTWHAAFLVVVPLVLAVAAALTVTSRESFNLEVIPLGIRETVTRLFGNPRYRIVLATYSMRSFSTGGVSSFLPIFLIATQGFSFQFASGAYALRFVVGIFAKPLSGVFGDRYSQPLIAVGSLLVTAMGVAMLVAAPTGLVALSGIVVYAIGQKTFGAPMQAYLMDSFPDDSMGGDLGATRTTYMGIGSLGPAVVGYVAGIGNYQMAYSILVAVLVSAAGLVVYFELIDPE